MIEQLFWPFYLGVGGPVGSGTQPLPWIHLNDLCGVFMHAMQNENVTGVLNATAPAKTTNGQFAKAFAAALGRPAFFTVIA